MEIMTTLVMETARTDAGRRADIVLAGEMDDMSRNRLQRLMEQGLITVSGKPVQKNYRVNTGDVFTCLIPRPIPYEASPECIPLDVVYEDAEVIVVNKPRGMVVHPAPGHYTGTLVHALLYRCAQLSDTGGAIRPGIVHRLDKDTSGLIVAAKTDRAHHHLAAQLAERTVKRVYHAVVRRNLPDDHLHIDLPISRHPTDRKRMAIAKPGAGRRAVTHVTALCRAEGYTLIEAKLETGRTHQIRVHMAHMGYPVLGDTVYGGEKQPFGLRGQVLHASALTFTHPVTGEELNFDAGWPAYFTETVENIWKKTSLR
jgi:23S rRNA pseudouridine1911/1915/1917 synthase